MLTVVQTINRCMLIVCLVARQRKSNTLSVAFPTTLANTLYPLTLKCQLAMPKSLNRLISTQNARRRVVNRPGRQSDSTSQNHLERSRYNIRSTRTLTLRS